MEIAVLVVALLLVAVPGSVEVRVISDRVCGQWLVQLDEF